MGFLDKVKDVTNAAADKVGDAAGKGKYTVLIKDETSKLNKQLVEIGRCFYEKIKAEEIEAPAEIEQYLENARANEAQIAEYQKRIDDINEGRD